MVYIYRMEKKVRECMQGKGVKMKKIEKVKNE